MSYFIKDQVTGMQTIGKHRDGRAAGSTLSRSAFAAFPLMAASLLDCRNVEDLAQASAMASAPQNSLSAPEERPKPRADASYTTGFTVGCPVWMVRVPDPPADFCIDRFEDHVAELRDGREYPHFPSLRPRKGMKLVAKASPDSYPQSSVNLFQAAQACFNAGKRLCSMREWKTACMGVSRTTYPYGNTEVGGVCNTRKPHLLSELHGSSNSKWTREDMDDPLINQILGYLGRPGEYSGCVSSFGAYDMVGNLHEWVIDLVDERLAASMPYLGKEKRSGKGPKSAVGNGIFMGGFASSANQNGNGCNYATIAHLPDHHDYSVGFRCCADVGR